MKNDHTARGGAAVAVLSLMDAWEAASVLCRFLAPVPFLISMLLLSTFQAFAKTAAHYATSSRSAQLITFSIGCLVFFDDYANVLLAGETMRPLTDMLFVSREKLAFIVDGTSAPIASLTPVSSWVGYEISLIQEERE